MKGNPSGRNIQICIEQPCSESRFNWVSGPDSDLVSGSKKAKMVYQKGETRKFHGFSILKDQRLFPGARKSSQRRIVLKSIWMGKYIKSLPTEPGTAILPCPTSRSTYTGRRPILYIKIYEIVKEATRLWVFFSIHNHSYFEG